MLAPARRAGVHARRTVEIQNRERSRRRGVPGTISGLRAGPVARLASETRLRAQCKHRPLQRSDITAGPRFARLAAGPPLVVGAAYISARRRLRRRGVRRDEGIPPYGRPGACALPVWPGVRHGL